MKKSVKILFTAALLLCTSYLNVNGLRAEKNIQQQACAFETGSGKILSLCFGKKSGIMRDDVTGNEFEFHYAGPETLEANAEYIYLFKITGSGKIIIRDIHRK